MESKTLTIFTPTYNRAYILPKLYNSLCIQSCKDFVWIVVDDGSSDNTEELFDIWKNENKIEIFYHRQENGGKMRAHNRAVELSQTELFVCVDSDDLLASPTSIEENLKFWSLQKSRNFNEQISYREIGGLISYKDIKGKKFHFPENMYCSTLHGLYEQGFRGETTLMLRTEVLREFPFPEIEGEKFITAAIVYDQIDIKYKFLLFPCYTQKCEYRIDGYTNNLSLYNWNNPKGYRLFYHQRLRLGIGNRYKNLVDYIFYSVIVCDGQTIKMSAFPGLTILFFPLGVLKYIKKKLQFTINRAFK
jgi:glycosyltransferase involved in cell wall biosynthesis